ncbi:MAG: HDOD domain-containing protein [Syntrophorhabdaceae bacterium]
MATTIPREHLINRASEIKVIPTLNAIANKVFSLIDNSNTSFNDLSSIVKYDQAISSKIISIANSAYYSRGIEIFNLQRAMLTIGFEEVRSIVTCILLMEGIMKLLKLKEADLLHLWKHSIEVACSSRVLSERMMLEDPQKVFTASLLHDIGKIIFYMSLTNYGAVLHEIKEADIAEFEARNFGIDHQETGYIIALKWKFPEDFARIIRYHHKNPDNGNADALMRLIRACDRFSYRTLPAHSSEAIILEKERDAIQFEVKKITELLRLDKL